MSTSWRVAPLHCIRSFYRATAGRQIERLYRANALAKRGFGAYSLKEVSR
jgi:hypothetical protein